MSRAPLDAFPLFAALPPGEAQRLYDNLPRRRFPPGELLVREGTNQGRMYFLLEGEVEVIKGLGTRDERQLAVRPAGSVVGEMSLFSEEGLHTASVRARTPLRALEIARAALDDLLQGQPSLAYALVRTMSRRLEESENQTIHELRHKNRRLRRAYQELAAAQAALIEKEKLEHEMEIAREIQQALLPPEPPDLPGYRFGLRMEPMRAVGGDFYDLLPLEDGSLGVAIGDVTGHGVPAALYMATTITLLRSEAHHRRAPRAVLRGVNAQLLRMGSAGAFVTLLYGRLNPPEGTFTYCRAGHEEPLLLDPAGAPTHIRRHESQLLGFFERPQLHQECVTLSPGAVLLLLTDGMTEVANSRGRIFGRERLLQEARALHNLEAQQVGDGLLARAKAHAGAAPLQDDMTLLVITAS